MRYPSIVQNSFTRDHCKYEVANAKKETRTALLMLCVKDAEWVGWDQMCIDVDRQDKFVNVSRFSNFVVFVWTDIAQVWLSVAPFGFITMLLCFCLDESKEKNSLQSWKGHTTSS